MNSARLKGGLVEVHIDLQSDSIHTTTRIGSLGRKDAYTGAKSCNNFNSYL